MTDCLRIHSGKVYDPINRIDGDIRPVLICDGRIVERLPDDVSPRTIDASAMVIMPGGIDMHCHIASPSVNRARAMQGEEHATHVHHACDKQHLRAGTGYLTPSTFTTGYQYAALGYTTAVEAAVAPTGARHTLLQLHDTPNVDTAFLLLVANHQKVLELIDRGESGAAIAFIGELLHRTGAYGIKVVNPGGVASWRNDPTSYTVETIDDPVAGLNVTPRKIIQLMASADQALKLPHPPHIHCNRLGVPANVQTTLATLDALDGRRAHLAHLQFHAYGQSEHGDYTSAAGQLCHYLNAHDHITADVGQVVFGQAFTLTADTPLEYLLWKLTGNRYHTIETELETGCGLMPIVYRDSQYLHSLQWAIGLELLLNTQDPWRMCLSTDHPNGGSFLCYPTIIAALMSKNVRDEQIALANQRAMDSSMLKDIDREMTLSEIAIITRAGPACALGMSEYKGHLGHGADADVTIYHDDTADPKRMFASPRYVIKGGRIIVEDGELRHPVSGSQHRAPVRSTDEGSRILTDWFSAYGSYDIGQFGLGAFERQAMRS